MYFRSSTRCRIALLEQTIFILEHLFHLVFPRR